MFIKDISWLWRAAYNAAVEGLGNWSDLQVARVFDMARQVRAVHSRAQIQFLKATIAHRCLL